MVLDGNMLERKNQDAGLCEGKSSAQYALPAEQAAACPHLSMRLALEPRSRTGRGSFELL